MPKVQSSIIPEITIDFCPPAPRSAAGFNYELNGRAVSGAEAKLILSYTDQAWRLLFAEACDLTWPRQSDEVVVVVFEDDDTITTRFNGSRVDVLTYYVIDSMLNVGKAGADCYKRITNIRFKNQTIAVN